MSPYLKRDRPHYYVWITLPSFGRVGPWSTGTEKRRTAERIEAWLREAALTRPEIVEGIVAGSYSLRDVWVANLRGHERMERLVDGRNDPRLTDVIERARQVVTDSRARTGLDHLEAWVEGTNARARLSWLDHTRISEFYAAMRGKMSAASVYRSPHRAVRELLTHELGSQETDERMRDVRVPDQTTRRDVDLGPKEIKRLVASCPTDRFRWMVTLAILTTADRKPLLALTPRHFDADAGTLRVPDTKTADRPRVVSLPQVGVSVLRAATAGHGPGERVFPWSPWQVRKMWDRTREDAKLPHVRFKDLRHLLPTTLAAMKVDRREIQALMGHAPGSRTTDRYIRPAGDVPTLAEAAERMGLAYLEAG